MNLLTNTLTGATAALIKTEIMFCVASAKALGNDLIQLYAEEKHFPTVSKILKAAKKDGLIQLFAISNDFDERTTEIEYLKNKYPDISSINLEKPFFLLKV